MKVLVIKSSMTEKTGSFSSLLSDRFMKHYLELHPEAEVTYLDLNEESAGIKSLTTNNFKEFWNPEDADKYINQLKSVDRVVMSTPMTNFHYPATTKNYIDHICVADKTFSYKYSKKGDAIGLLTNLKVQLLTSQGAPLGWYPWGDHTENLRGIWNFLGAQVAKPFILAGTKVAPATELSKEAYLDSFDAEIKALAAEF
ncbi:FMN-dependent NADH-azoreductase [Mycoplasma iguanae]|uniref:FMN dependent NADH:quinone oxidoreductase n=1 Tax=Mycoplasma iguanae TaxID=292461 RepID=A0ABY5R8I9_9MOLU|nr:FMN-dependent NADH-azoreductase [Mycoplasma iguanae]UVD81818.1 FMN-dependent NADH-azoreductase [Mycoplasma iguanae]